jgi:hypothetical protein
MRDLSHLAHWARCTGMGLAVAAFLPVCASARTIAIINGTRTAMISLQARQADTPVWQTGLLNHRTLGIQKQVEFTVPDRPNCFFEIMAMFEDGHRVAKRANLCKSNVYLLTDF